MKISLKRRIYKLVLMSTIQLGILYTVLTSPIHIYTIYINTIYKGPERMTSMIKFIILGFLTSKSLTGYDIKQIMIQSTSNFANASFGSIYPALNKLEKDGLINSTKIIEDGKYKKVYSINETGIKMFIRWLEEPIDFMRSYEDILAKVFFYEKLPKEKVFKLIEKLVEDINKKLEELEKLEIQIRGSAGHFEISTLYFGIDHLKFMVKWYEKFLEDLNNM